MFTSQALSSVINYIPNAVSSLGYFGIFILMAIESTIFPLPGELVLIPAGVLASKGSLNIFLIIISSSFGSLFGSLISYSLAFYIGRKLLIGKYGNILFLNKESLKRIDSYFINHGEITIFLGRLFPVVRHLISLPAGFAKMSITRFSLYTFIGSAIWATIVVYLGSFFGAAIAKQNLNLAIFWIALLGAILLILYIIAHNHIKNSHKKDY